MKHRASVLDKAENYDSRKGKRQYHQHDADELGRGTIVVFVSENGSAAKSGLQVGDILCRYEGVDITSFEILS